MPIFENLETTSKLHSSEGQAGVAKHGLKKLEN